MAQKFLGIASLMTKKIVIELLKLKEAILLSQIILNSIFFFNFEKKTVNHILSRLDYQDFSKSACWQILFQVPNSRRMDFPTQSTGIIARSKPGLKEDGILLWILNAMIPEK